MSYRVQFTPAAAKQISKLDRLAARRIRTFLQDRVSKLDDPRVLGTKLVERDFWRYRVGDYRILAHIEDDRLVVLVVGVAHRRDVYRDL